MCVAGCHLGSQPGEWVASVWFASRPPPLGAFLTTLAGWAVFSQGNWGRKRVWMETPPRHLVGLFRTGPKHRSAYQETCSCWGRSGKQKVRWSWGARPAREILPNLTEFCVIGGGIPVLPSPFFDILRLRAWDVDPSVRVFV